MAGANLLALIDDIATLLDDVAVLSKVAVKKTAGVLGDDLALNAEQVSGVKAERELPVVWAVAKGSLLNKIILVPSALLISAVAPWLVVVLLVIGGLYLCFEGFEKVFHRLLHSQQQRDEAHKQQLAAIADPHIDLVSLEKNKIKGAIRTDFILSAEIVVIVLGTVQASSFSTQVTVLSLLALGITVGVYGLVAAIVKIDDLGLYFLRQPERRRFSQLQQGVGRSLLIIAPLLMKALAIIGTIAMFLVGGGIIVHSIGFLHHALEPLYASVQGIYGVSAMLPVICEGLIGVVAGGLVMLIVKLLGNIVAKFK